MPRLAHTYKQIGPRKARMGAQILYLRSNLTRRYNHLIALFVGRNVEKIQSVLVYPTTSTSLLSMLPITDKKKFRCSPIS